MSITAAEGLESPHAHRAVLRTQAQQGWDGRDAGEKICGRPPPFLNPSTAADNRPVHQKGIGSTKKKAI